MDEAQLVEHGRREDEGIPIGQPEAAVEIVEAPPQRWSSGVRCSSYRGQPPGCAPGTARNWPHGICGPGKSCGTTSTSVVSSVCTGAVFGVILTRISQRWKRGYSSSVCRPRKKALFDHCQMCEDGSTAATLLQKNGWQSHHGEGESRCVQCSCGCWSGG